MTASTSIALRLPAVSLAALERPLAMLLVTCIEVLVAVLLPLTALAQDGRPVTAAVHGGVSSSEAGTRAIVGGAVTFRVAPKVEVEGAATWFTERRWSSAFVASAAARIAIGAEDWSEAVVPFVAGGAGYHRAVVTLADPRLLGPVPAAVPAGDRYCAGTGRGPGGGPAFDAACGAGTAWGVGDLPAFYARRLGTLVVPADRRWPNRTFSDPAVMLGGGVRVTSDRGLIVQPEARVWMVIADGRTRTSALVGVSVGVGF